MKKLLILSLLTIILLNVGCKKKYSETSQSGTNSTAVKCPNCGSNNTKVYELGGHYCNTCEVAF